MAAKVEPAKAPKPVPKAQDQPEYSTKIWMPQTAALILPKKSVVDRVSARFRNMLPDIDDLTKRIIDSDLDHTQAIEVMTKADDLVDWAPNVLAWCADKRFLGMRPFAKQAEILLHLYEEWCPRCSDQNYVYDIPLAHSIETVMAKIALLEFGKCPHCGFRKGDGRKSGVFKDPLELIAIVGQRAGKCVVGTTEVFDGKRRRTVESLVGETFCVPTKDRFGKVVWGNATAFASGTKPCVRLTLADGSAVTLSSDHRVYTSKGWAEAGALKPRDLVATPRVLPSLPPDAVIASDSEVALAAYLLADGNVIDGTRFTNQTPEVVADFTRVANELADGNLTERSNRKVTPEVRTAMLEMANTGLTQTETGKRLGTTQSTVSRVLSGKEVACLSGVSSQHGITYSVRGLHWFRDKWCINGLSKHKRIPDSFWSLSDRQVGLFLNRFFACDGYVDHHSLGVTLASEKMIDDLKFMFNRLGLRAAKHYKAATCEGQTFDSWRLSVYGRDALEALKIIGPILGKEQACIRLQALLESSSTRKDGGRKMIHDRVPVGRTEITAIATEMENAGEIGRGKRGGKRHAMREFCSAKGDSHVSRGLFEAFCREFNYTGCQSWLATSDLRWEYVDSVEEVGSLPVFDLSVPDTECFVGDNVVLHNSAVASMAISYLIHRNAMLPVPWKSYGLTPGQVIDFTVVATTVSQSEKTLWSTFKGIFESSSWFKSYKQVSDEEGKKSGLKATIVAADTYIWFEHKRMLIYFASNNPSGLRGTTRMGAAIDELGWFDAELGSMKTRANGPETYAALSNACLTLRAAFSDAKKADPNTTVPVPLMLNISSPRSMDDAIMSIYRDMAGNPRIVRRHWATWEMNPTLPKSLLIETGDLLKPNGARDYAAQPPLADDPLIRRVDTVTEAFKNPLAIEHRYGRIIRLSAQGFLVDLEVQSGHTVKEMLSAELELNVEPPNYALLKNLPKLDFDELGPHGVLFNDLMRQPAARRPHIMGVDLGSSNNALAIVCGYLAENGETFITDFVFEVKPEAAHKVNMADVYSQLIIKLVEGLNVVAVYYDRWSCLTGDTLVYTESGMQKLSDLRKDEEGVFFHEVAIATKDGVHQTSHWGRLPPQQVYDVNLKGGYSVAGTAEHKLWAATDDDRSPDWVTIGDLKPGAWVGLSSPGLWPTEEAKIEYQGRPDKVVCAECGQKMDNLVRHVIFSHKMTWEAYKEAHQPAWTQTSTGKAVRWPATVTPELARLLGYLVSEGTYGSEFFNTNHTVVQDYATCFELTFGVAPSVVLRQRSARAVAGNKNVSVIKDGYQVLTSSVDISRFIVHLLGGKRKSAEKEIPESVLRSPKHVVKEFLRGLYEGDGCCSTKAKRIVYDSVSPVLLQQITSVLANFGIWCFEPGGMVGWNAVRFMDEIGFVTKTGTFDVNAGAKDYVPAKKLIRAFVEKARARLHPSDNFLHHLIYTMGDITKATLAELDRRFASWPEYPGTELAKLSQYHWRRVVGVVSRRDLEPVYDVTVPGTHSFIANGIISHNSLHQIQDLCMKYGALGPLNPSHERRAWQRDLSNLKTHPAFIADQYSLNVADASMLVSRLEQGDCLFPAMEVDMMELMVNKSLDPTDYPYAHLALQMATIRARGNRLLKPVNRDDDLFRAWANAAVKAFRDDLVIDMLKQENRAVVSKGRTKVNAHVSLGMVGKGLRQGANMQGGTHSNSGVAGFPVIVRKGKFGSQKG